MKIHFPFHTSAIKVLNTRHSESLKLNTYGHSDCASKRKQIKYAVVEESFRHEKGGTPLQFNIGQHCLIDHESALGIAVVCCNYGVYFPTAEIANHFDIVEI